jgi:similar to stage IV sporulation protein
MVQILATSADISALLMHLNTRGISVHYVRFIDDLSASFCVQQNQCPQALREIDRAGGRIDQYTPASGTVWLKAILRRPVLIFGIALLLIMTLYLPTRILFVTVSGNQRISDREILEAAISSDVYFGVPRREIRSENIKNRLLSELPELKWVGVNTAGCVAQISVRERVATDQSQDYTVGGNIVAGCDGVIREMTVISGTAVCHVGQAVKKGELLVTGKTDCGNCVYITRANAEIYAKTFRTLRLTTLTDGTRKTVPKETKRKYGLIIGKKRINFFKGSGILDTTCVRMYMEYPLTLPGGFQLPIALTIQEDTVYETVPSNSASAERENALRRYAQDYLGSQMIAGKVEREDCYFVETEGARSLVGQYTCDEIIGQTYSEEFTRDYEQTD